MKPSKRNPIDSNVLGHAKKPRLVSVQQFRCGNGLCNRPFKNERGLKSHYRNSIICAMRASSASASSSIGGLKNVPNTCVAIASSTLASSECSEATEESDSVVESEASPIFFPWDDESSIDESDHANNLIQYEDIVETQFGNLNDFVDCNNPSNSQSIVPPASIVRPPISFHTHSFMETKLLKLLNDVNAPHSLYQNVMNWASEAKKDGYEFRSGRTTRAAQVKHLEKWLGLKYCRPETKMLCLPGDMLFVPVTSFDFKSVLFSLLSNPKLVGDITKLDVNQDDPFARYVAKDGLLSCVNSGQFYNDAYDNMIKDPSKELLILIIMCSDETMLSKGGKAGAWPMMFTLGIFGQLLRNTAASYGPLGYLYDLSIVNSKEERKNMDIDLKYKRLHAIMGRVLESYIKTTKNDELKDIPMQLDKFHKTVTIKCPTVFIIGDMVGGDKLCCCSPTYSNTLNRMCRKCNVRGSESGDPFVKCKRMSQDKIVALIKAGDKKTLAYFHQYNVHSACFDLEYGGCRFGIFSAASPVEALHALENGLIPACMTVLFMEQMGPSQRNSLDGLIRLFTNLPRQRYMSSGAEKEMPRLLWKDGITCLSELEAKNKLAIMFTVVVFSLTDLGQDFFYTVFKSHEKLDDMRQVFQMMLCYWMWLKKTTYWRRGDKRAKEEARLSIQTMLHQLITLWPRASGQKWEMPKIHEQSHVVDDIERHGAPRGSHTGPTEHNHIIQVKRPARNTQRRRNTLDQQIGARVAETYIINTAHAQMAQTYTSYTPEPTLQINGYPRYSLKGLIYIYSAADESATEFESRVDWISSTSTSTVHPIAITLIEQHFGSLLQGPSTKVDRQGRPCLRTVSFGTEYLVDRIVYRGNYCYRQSGTWCDWAMFRWPKQRVQGRLPNVDVSDPNVSYGDSAEVAAQHDYAPGEIYGFVSMDDGSHSAIVRRMNRKHAIQSVFTTHWSLMYKDREKTIPCDVFVNVKQIVRHCLMIPTNNEKTEFEEIWTRDRWAAEF